MTVKFCKTCGVVHFPVDTYKRWLSRYSSFESKRVAEQIPRWQAIVDKHTRKLKLHEAGGTGVQEAS